MPLFRFLHFHSQRLVSQALHRNYIRGEKQIK